MKAKLEVRFVSPVDAVMSRPVETARRCINCAHYPCDLIEKESNGVKKFYQRVIRTECEHFTRPVTIVSNDPFELQNLARFAMGTR